MVNMGVCLQKGEGVSTDKFDSAEMFRKAAESGHVQAQLFLGNSYAEGQGVKQDMDEAMQWWRKAARQGDPNAQFNIADCFATGKAGLLDFHRAAEWYKKAADQAHSEAQFNYVLATARARAPQKRLLRLGTKTRLELKARKMYAEREKRKIIFVESGQSESNVTEDSYESSDDGKPFASFSH